MLDRRVLEHLDRVCERRSAFLRREMGSQILARFSVRGLHPGSHLRHVPDYRKMCQVQIEYLEARQVLEDDAIPMIQTHFGMGIFGAIFGSKVTWRPQDQTSWSDPPFGAWPDDYADRLVFDRDNDIVTLVRRAIRHCREAAGGRFGIGLLETIDALNLVNELRGGTNGFMDLYLHPDTVREVMELGVKWNIDWLEMQMAETGQFAGGWVSLVDWFPWPTVWLSVDAYGCCRVDTYVDMGREYMQRLIDHFGHGWQHLHADGMRLLPEIVKLRNLAGIQIGEDVGYPRPFEVLRDVQRVTGDIPLQIGCTYEEFARDLEGGKLPGGVEYHVRGTPSIAEANRLAAQSRHYRDPRREAIDGHGAAARHEEPALDQARMEGRQYGN